MLNKKPVSTKDDTSETKDSKNHTAVSTKKVAESAPAPAADKIKTDKKEPEPIEAKWSDDKSDKPKKDVVAKEQPEKETSTKAPPKKKPKKVWKNERYALPEPCGHTANVHPTNSNNDREWYTEYRWQPGTAYKPQDGPITEVPKPALRGISVSPVSGDPCV